MPMFNADGSMRKTAKSKLLRSFSYVSLVDMDLHPQHLMIVMQRHVMGQMNYGVITSIIILINDNYTVVTIIKDDEHKQRTATHTDLPNVYPKEAQKFPTPSQFKRIMLKSENKVKLQKKYSIRKKSHFLFSGERGGVIVLIFRSNFANLLPWDFEYSLERLNVNFIFLKLYLYCHLRARLHETRSELKPV